MESRELRIGNKVYHPAKNIVFTISREDFSFKNGLANIEDFRAIPLTEEILLKKCGFEFDSVYISYNNGYFTLIYNEGHISLVVEGQWLTLEIKYLHQLQNLYFALTGEELTVNL